MGMRNITRFCLSKQSFSDRAAAEAELAKLRGQHSRYRQMRVYRCDACAQYHLGNSGRKRRVG